MIVMAVTTSMPNDVCRRCQSRVPWCGEPVSWPSEFVARLRRRTRICMTVCERLERSFISDLGVLIFFTNFRGMPTANAEG